MNTLMETLTPQQQAKLLQGSEFRQAVDSYEKTLKPYQKVWKGLGILAGIVAAIFGAGVAYQQFMGGNATKDDIKTELKSHVDNDLVPVREQVVVNTQTLHAVSSGVDKLVRLADAETKVQKAQQVVDAYQRDHEEKITDWMAAKAAGRHPAKPEKRPELVQAELALKDAKEQLLRVQ